MSRFIAPHGGARLSFPDAGLTFRAPANWTVTRGQPPSIAIVQGNEAIIALWRYPRSEPLPVSAAQLRQATAALLRTVRAHDHSFAVGSSRITRVAHQPAIDLTGAETIAGQPRRVHSVHVFHAGVELVLDSYCPAAQFGAVDRLVFAPLLRSVRLGPVRLGPMRRR